MNADHDLLRRWSEPTSGAHCSPILALLDLQVNAVDRAHGSVVLRFTVPEALRKASGEPAGRAVAAMLDCALSFAAMARLEPSESIVTATLRMEAVATSSSSDFDARGILVASNDVTMFVRASLHDGAERLVALASATLRRVQVAP